MHQGEQHKQAGYYKQLGEAIQNYESVLLFGPTDAKSELLNLLRKDHHFDDIKIEVQSAMEMPIKQEHAFVRDHFSQM